MVGIGGVLMLAWISFAVCLYVLLYKAWSVIQDGRPRTTPGQAIGFLFIPFFNLYWIFVAYRGLAEDLNRYGQRIHPPARIASEGAALAFCILFLCSFVPCVNVFSLPAAGVCQLIALYTIKNAAADIAAAKLQTP
jgi:hypothetical protein